MENRPSVLISFDDAQREVCRALQDIPEHRYEAQLLADCRHYAGKQSRWCRNRFCTLCRRLDNLTLMRKAEAQIAALTTAYPGAVLVGIDATATDAEFDGEVADRIKRIGAGVRRLATQPGRHRPLTIYGQAEVTPSPVSDGVSPHVHLNLLMQPGFPFTGRAFVRKSLWADLWQDLLGHNARDLQWRICPSPYDLRFLYSCKGYAAIADTHDGSIRRLIPELLCPTQTLNLWPGENIIALRDLRAGTQERFFIQ